MIYIKAKQIYHDMRELYTQELRKKFPNCGKEFQGLAILLKQNGFFEIMISEHLIAARWETIEARGSARHRNPFKPRRIGERRTIGANTRPTKTLPCNIAEAERGQKFMAIQVLLIAFYIFAKTTFKRAS